MNSFERFSFNLLGARAKSRRDDFVELRSDLMQARIKTPFEAYLSTAYLSSLIAGLGMALLIGTITFLLNIPSMITYRGAVPGFLTGLSDFRLLIGTSIAVALSLLIFGGVTYLSFMMYPKVVAGNRRRNINATLPYAINYVTAMSTAGITPAEVFRLLGESPIYGETAVEARFITREIDMFGKDLIEAMRIVSTFTPSPRMKEFLQGAMATISSGANLTNYFRNKATQYTQENHQEQKGFLETLGLIAESYVTAMVAGTLFLIILQSIMSIIGGDASPIFLIIIIYLIVPFGSIMFVILISSMTPEV
ncbi:Type II secretion system F domain protein [Methanofollis liminatans DSM 4140]|jgi:flagellar protein FlaJ|uniref:Type II secretion system F domain protein n=1 Tax=Methanofollis liminatans DSM 4140 TaxID=28892 RepID=J0S1G9_9EURY|nr:type II secretion system F family protein [Methanofollis liminatans]EJG07726.1 Type II secretion system F domain protein [Methanofollis liminatans DSM 4140]